VVSVSGSASPNQPNLGFGLMTRSRRLSGRIHRCVSTCRNGSVASSGFRAADSSATNLASAVAVRSGERRNASPQL
jgi:hypothetical protein